ncbi:MAG: Nif3-like dinuclear metal center hexameric protein [Pirellulales bacterium]
MDHPSQRLLGIQPAMYTIHELASFLEEFAPARLAADWDNVGLLIGERARSWSRAMTCLTVTPETVAEALREKADAIVAHHPFPFKSLKRITDDTPDGALLLKLLEAKIAILSPHTAFDSTIDGINERLAGLLGLSDIRPLSTAHGETEIGVGRSGVPAAGVLGELAAKACRALGISGVQLVGSPGATIKRVGIGCGSAGELLSIAKAAGCDCFVTGEARFHTALEAQSLGMTMLLLGHYASERFALDGLAERLAGQFPRAVVWSSRDERDPIAAFPPYTANHS